MQRWPTTSMIDLLRFAGGLYHRQVKLLKSGLPGKRDMLGLNQLLLQPLDLTDIRNFEDSGYLLFLYELGYQLDLFVEREGILKPHTKACQTFAQNPPEQQRQRLESAYQRLVLWNEWQHLTQIHQQTLEENPNAFTLRLKQLHQCRETLLGKLPQWLETPQPLSEILRLCQKETPDLLRLSLTPEGDYPGIFLYAEAGPIQPATYPRDWPQVEGALVTQMLSTSLRWLGWIVEDTRTGLWHYPTPTTTPPSQPTEFIVQSNLDLMLFPGHDQLALLLELEAFCKPLDGEHILRLRIDKKRFFNALQQGKDFDEMCQCLQQRSRTPLPENALQLLQSWHNQSNQIVVSKRGTIVEADSTKEWAALCAQWPQEIPFRTLDERRRFVPFYALEALYEWLPQPQEIDYLRPPPKSLHIDAALQVEITPPFDLMLLPFFDKIAHPLPEQQGRQRYQITAASLSSAISQHTSFDEILAFLTMRAKVFSSTAQLRLETFAGQHRHISVEQMTIIRTPTPELLDRLLHEGGLAALLLRLGPTSAVIPDEHLDEINQILLSFSLPQAPSPHEA